MFKIALDIRKIGLGVTSKVRMVDYLRCFREHVEKESCELQ